jgi:flagellar FliL protein
MPKKRVILLLVFVVLVAGVAGGGFVVYNKIASRAASDAPPPPPPPKVTLGPVYPVEPFLVNLADPGRPKFLKVVMQLELDSAAVVPELDGLKPKVRDSLLTLLSSKGSADLATVADKERLRNEIIHRLNAFLAAGRVVEVYFSEFVVQ